MLKNLKVRNVYPEIETGRYPVKWELDRTFTVFADVSCKKNLKVYLSWRKKTPPRHGALSAPPARLASESVAGRRRPDKEWANVKMKFSENTWKAGIRFRTPGIYEYTVKIIAERKSEIFYKHILEVIVEPEQARFSSWYTMWARSQGKIQGRSATLKDMEGRLADVKNMGFDVILLSPVHPIGRTNRKGPNNRLRAKPADPGSPYAIGNELGGHKSIDKSYGTIGDFRRFVKTANKMKIKIALDIALQCSPDHPYVKKHPQWFHHQKNGTIRYAENPPKKYEDIYPLNFYPPDRKAMWEEMKNIFVFWIKQGVKIFRVDNPHTKPTEFWEWLIKEIKFKYPETIFLAEAFTNYERLEIHAKIGFSQSYTYFLWRDKKNAIIEYFTKLTNSYLKEFMRGNLFTSTPNILSKVLQKGGKPAFKVKTVLAATLSSCYGIYNGYELCENKAVPRSEDYKDSEIFQYKVWDWNRAGNIKNYISKINKIRRGNSALQFYDNLKFYPSTDGSIISYGKISPEGENIILIVVNLDPLNTRETRITIPLNEFKIPSGEVYTVRELITGRVYNWKQDENYIQLNPKKEPAYIFKIEKGKKKTGLPPPSRSGTGLAKKHGKLFFELREKVIKHNNIYAKRQLVKLYNKEIISRVYAGESYDDSYATQINKISAARSYSSIVKAYITTPGH